MELTDSQRQKLRDSYAELAALDATFTEEVKHEAHVYDKVLQTLLPDDLPSIVSHWHATLHAAISYRNAALRHFNMITSVFAVLTDSPTSPCPEAENTLPHLSVLPASPIK